VDLANITVPTLLVAGGLDMNPGPAVSQFAYDRINSTDKAFVLIPNAVHRSFDSTYCDELKSAGA
jgi:predicted dienelactone hydrolase